MSATKPLNTFIANCAYGIRQKSYAVLGVLAVAVVAALFGGGNVSGKAVSYIPVELDFPVMMTNPVVRADVAEWTDCSNQDVDWEDLDNFCKSKGFEGAVPIDYKPCLHKWAGTRYYWNGEIPMRKGSQKTAGYALTAVKCLVA